MTSALLFSVVVCLALISATAPTKKEEDMHQNYEVEEWDERVERFADPGGTSALYPASESNPRCLPCPSCGRANVLTPADRMAGYQCDACADALEGGYGA